MTKKDYVAAARIVKELVPANPSGAAWAADAFVKLFQPDNPRFDVTRFLDACRLSREGAGQ